MKIRCEYCGNYLSDTDETCPSCGAPNEHLVRGAEGEPKTIEELRAFAAKHSLPLEQMRFFLGEDCREPRAFGIYRETNGDFVVYKNKSDGQRAERYRGKDEAFAVNELWQKMRSEVLLRKRNQRNPQGQPDRSEPEAPYRAPRRRRRRGPNPVLIIVILMLLFSGLQTLLKSNLNAEPSWQRGYYSYDGGHYYRSGYDDWYAYDDAAEDWTIADVDSSSPLYTDADDYYEGSWYTEGADYGDFSDSEYYSSDSSSRDDDWDSNWDDDDDWDSDWDDDDWDWDSGSDWDSGDTDWDSDW